MAESGMLSFSHVSVKTNTQQSLASCCVDRLSWIKSSLFSRERTFESMSVGRAGLVGLALSLARIPPRFRPLSHRLRRCLVRVASVGEAAVSRSGSSSKQRPRSFSVAAGESWCLYALPISKRLRRSYMCFGVISLCVSGKFTLFGDKQTTLKDIKAPSLGPGAAAASERAAIFI